MAKNRNYTVKVKRKLEVKTNYRKRLLLLKSNKPRLIIRKSLNNIRLQLVEYKKEGDKIIVSAYSRELRKFGWNFHLGNIPSAYLTGYLLGKKSKNVKEAILDLGIQRSIKGSIIYAALKGAIDAGMNINCDKEMFPTEDRIKGAHTKKQDIDKSFNEVKKKIENG
jgi:large subunit ribosomal protein L18